MCLWYEAPHGTLRRPALDAGPSVFRFPYLTVFNATGFRVHRPNAADARNGLRKFLMSAARTGRSVGARNDN